MIDNPSEMETLLLEKFRKLFGKGSDWSDDMYVAYTELLAEHPDREKELYTAYMKVSAALISNKRISLDLGESFESVWWDEIKDCWVGQTDVDTQPVELPSWTKSYTRIEWDADIADWVGYTDSPRKNPAVVEEPGRGVAIDVFTGKEAPI